MFINYVILSINTLKYMKKRNFITLLATSPILLFTGCKSTTWGESETEKLMLTLEQAAFSTTLVLKKDPVKQVYLKRAASVIDKIVSDGVADPSDILYIILESIDNEEVLLALTSIITIYKIWFLETAQSQLASKLLSAISQGIHNALREDTRSINNTTSSNVSLRPKTVTFKSKALTNAVNDHFSKYQ